MATFGDLPPEVRALVYEHLFTGHKLTYKPPLRTHIRAGQVTSGHPPTPSTPAVSILLVSQQCHSEARSALLKHITLNITAPISNGRLLSHFHYPVAFTSSLGHVEVRLQTLLFAPRARSATRRFERSLARLPNLCTLTLALRAENKHAFNLDAQKVIDRDDVNGLSRHATTFIQSNPHLMMDRGPPHQFVRKAVADWNARHRSYDLRTRVQLRYISHARPRIISNGSNRKALPTSTWQQQRALDVTYDFGTSEMAVEAVGAGGTPRGGPFSTTTAALRMDFAERCTDQKPCNPYCHTSGM